MECVGVLLPWATDTAATEGTAHSLYTLIEYKATEYYRLPKMVSPAMPYFIKPELNNGDFFNAADRVCGSLHKKPCIKKYGKQTSMSLVKLIWCTGATSNPSRGIGHHSVLETNHLNNWLVPFGFLPQSAMDLPYSKRHATDSSVRWSFRENHLMQFREANLIHIVLPAFLRFKFAVD